MFRALRSHKFYVPLITVVGSAALFFVYYFFYVSWQRTYANERAFRLLATVGDQMVEKIGSGTLSPLPEIKIGGLTADVQFAGLNITPGEFQFNLVVPPSVSNGDQSITATYRGVTTQSGALITILR